MSLKLPPSDSPIRALFDMRQLAEVGDPANRPMLPKFPEALANARAFLEDEPDARSICMFALSSNGKLWLLRISKSGSCPVWNFDDGGGQ